MRMSEQRTRASLKVHGYIFASSLSRAFMLYACTLCIARARDLRGAGGKFSACIDRAFM